jgi:hypothetical protein
VLDQLHRIVELSLNIHAYGLPEVAVPLTRAFRWWSISCTRCREDADRPSYVRDRDAGFPGGRQF